jgi:hypothetical protein
LSFDADIAQLVEQHFRKVKVGGSIPPIGSIRWLQASVVQWQYASFPSWRYGSDSRHSHQKLIHKLSKNCKLSIVEIPKKFLHDRAVLLLITLMCILVVIGVSVVLLRFDVSRNPTTIVAYRPNVSGTQYLSGKPIDIYSLAVFMIFTSIAAVIISARIYSAKRPAAIFMLSSTIFLLILSTIVANSLISIQ